MNKPLIVAITGGIGSGKSTFSNIIQQKGFPVYNTDDAGKRLQTEDPAVVKGIKHIFGEDIYADGQLDRKKVASIVFRNPFILKKLTDIVHPAVHRDFENWVKLHTEKDVLFIECAVLFEGGFDALVDKIIVVHADDEIRIKRIEARDQMERSQIIQRMKNQLNIDFLISKADFVILTDQGINTKEVDLLIDKIKKGG